VVDVEPLLSSVTEPLLASGARSMRVGATVSEVAMAVAQRQQDRATAAMIRQTSEGIGGLNRR
jgi:hypothetical protein